jgi:hypothetical protein
VQIIRHTHQQPGCGNPLQFIEGQERSDRGIVQLSEPTRAEWLQSSSLGRKALPPFPRSGHARQVPSVERLSAEDRLILWPDEVWPQDIGALGVLDGSNLLDSDGRFRIDDAKRAVEGRLHLLPRFRQVLYVPRRGLGGPLWVDAPAFDLSDHVRVEQLRTSADEAELLRAVARLRGRRLDKSRPTMGDVVPYGAP